MNKKGALFTVLILSLAAAVLTVFHQRNFSSQDAKKKLLVLIIASDNHPAFLELQEIWRSYMHLDPEHVKAYFIKGDPDLKKPSLIKGDILYTKGLDSYQPGILKKTVLSLEALSDKLEAYDYVLRTNLSSFYDFPKLLKTLDTLPKEKCYAAVARLPSYNVPPDLLSIPFGWGAGFLLSTDLAQLMVNQKEELFTRGNDAPDDVLIGAFFHRRNVPILPAACFSFQTLQEWHEQKDLIPKEVFHYRAKSHYNYRKLDDPYNEEIAILNELVQKHYPTAPLKRTYTPVYPLNLRLITLHEHYTAEPSDINQHLPTLRKLAKEGSSVTEIGIRTPHMASSWSLLQGLAESHHKKRIFTGIGEITPSLESLLIAKSAASENGISFNFIQADELNLDIAPTDLLFIDSLHTYAHLAYELETFAPNVRRYIVLHDTSEPWGEKDDETYLGNYSEYPKEIDRTKRGLWQAVVDFLEKHPEWTLKERYLNNHGLTVLQKVTKH
jgi:hypothetical protein